MFKYGLSCLKYQICQFLRSYHFCWVAVDDLQFIMKVDDRATLLTTLLGSDQYDVTCVTLSFAVEWHNTCFIFSVRVQVFNVCLV